MNSGMNLSLNFYIENDRGTYIGRYSYIRFFFFFFTTFQDAHLNINYQLKNGILNNLL